MAQQVKRSVVMTPTKAYSIAKDFLDRTYCSPNFYCAKKSTLIFRDYKVIRTLLMGAKEDCTLSIVLFPYKNEIQVSLCDSPFENFRFDSLIYNYKKSPQKKELGNLIFKLAYTYCFTMTTEPGLALQ